MKKLLASTRSTHSAIYVRRLVRLLLYFLCLFTWRGRDRHRVTLRDSYIILESSLAREV